MIAATSVSLMRVQGFGAFDDALLPELVDFAAGAVELSGTTVVWVLLLVLAPFLELDPHDVVPSPRTTTAVTVTIHRPSIARPDRIYPPCPIRTRDSTNFSSGFSGSRRRERPPIDSRPLPAFDLDLDQDRAAQLTRAETFPFRSTA
jgi:hypothetical protein